MKGILVVNAQRCLGCKSCELACAVEHSKSGDLFEAINEYPLPSSRVDVVKGTQFAVPLQCRQCEDAPCAAVCPTDALYRADQDSPVLIDQDKCIGCKWCVLACPFGVIELSDKSKSIIKCDQCFERVERGLMPACVTACPTSALQFKSLDDVVAEKREAYLLQIEGCLAGGEK
jgi:anaerobic carbon-monoxide dehydrogenase iron sulfur subunit